jgi:hypothetical protein
LIEVMVGWSSLQRRAHGAERLRRTTIEKSVQWIDRHHFVAWRTGRTGISCSICEKFQYGSFKPMVQGLEAVGVECIVR